MFTTERILTAGIDAGNGELKTVISINGGEDAKILSTKFPMVWYPGTQRYSSDFVDESSMKPEEVLDVTVQYEGQEPVHYFFGKLATNYPGAEHVYDRNKVEHPALRAAMYTSLALLQDKKEQIYWVCTGTPYKEYAEMKPIFENKLPGKCEITFNGGSLKGQKRTVTILRAKAMFQGYGIYVNQMMDFNGKTIDPELMEGYIGIIDIGQGTTNFILVKNGHPDDPSCDTTDRAAMRNVFNSIRAKLKDKPYEVDIEGAELIDIYEKGVITIGGIKYNLRENGVISDAHKNLVSLLAQQLINKWPKIKLFKKILIGGGGGIAIGSYFNLAQKEVVKDQFANAKGYLKAANIHINSSKPQVAAIK